MMRLLKRLVMLAGVVTLASSTLDAQGAPKLEFGVDLRVMSSKLDVPQAERVFSIGTPVDVRIGFVRSQPLMLETRFTFTHNGSCDASFTSFAPSLNVHGRLGDGAGLHNQMAPYLTAGLLMQMLRASNDNDSNSQTRYGLTAGAGTRIAWGTVAFRPEVFMARHFEKGELADDDFVPGEFAFGVLFGLSFYR